MEIIFGVFLGLVGAAMGSFACCQAWRLRQRDKSTWSHCMSCDYRLAWYDNLPILSWLFLKGRCRKCGEKIGWLEFLTELLIAALFVIVGLSWGVADVWSAVFLFLFLVLLVGLAILFVSDAKWGRLPALPLTFCIVCASIWVALKIGLVFLRGDFVWDLILNYMGALMLLPLLYFLLYKLSREQWVGAGDWLLALPVALVLGDFWLAFYCLFAANLLGSLVMFPVMKIRGKKTNMRIPFGPFLIVAFLVVFLLQDYLINIINLN